jgi:hypothetical protein
MLIDPETGEHEEYIFFGSGADNGDKALYKAITGGHKFFLAANFNVAEDMEPENDKDDIPKAELLHLLLKNEKKLRKDSLTKMVRLLKCKLIVLKKALKLLREADPEQEEFIAAVSGKDRQFHQHN